MHLPSLTRTGSVRVILVTEPGPTPEVPIKVVPIYFDVPATLPVDIPHEEGDRPETREKTALLGAMALALAVVAGVFQALAIGVSTAGDFSLGTVLAYLAIALAVAAFIGATVAILLDRGRRLGVVAAVVAIIANPYILLGMLRLFGSGAG